MEFTYKHQQKILGHSECEKYIKTCVRKIVHARIVEFVKAELQIRADDEGVGSRKGDLIVAITKKQCCQVVSSSSVTTREEMASTSKVAQVKPASLTATHSGCLISPESGEDTNTEDPSQPPPLVTCVRKSGRCPVKRNILDL